MPRTELLSALLFALSFSPVLVAQRAKDFSWRKTNPVQEIAPEAYPGEDAVMIYQYRTITNKVADAYRGEMESTETVMRRIKVLTKAGIAGHTDIVVSKRPQDKLMVLDARTIRRDGKVVDLDAKEIKRLDLKDAMVASNSLQQWRFSIPGVEVGDEVEMVYSVRSRYLRTGADVYLNTYLPVRHSVFVLDLDKSIVTDLRTMNGMPEAKVQQGLTDATYRWEMHDLPSIENEKYAVRSVRFPLVSFIARELLLGDPASPRRYPITPASADVLYDRYVQAFNVGNGTDGPVRHWIMKDVPEREGEAPWQRMYRVLDDLRDHWTVRELSDEEAEEPLAYHMERHVIDPSGLEQLLWQAFDIIDLDRWVGFGRHCHEGPFDPAFVSPHMVSCTFFAFKDANNEFRFLFPATPEHHYEMDELPWYLEGTQPFLMHKPRVGSLKCETARPMIQRGNEEVNMHKRRRQVMVDLEQRKGSASDREFWSGTQSTRHRTPVLRAIAQGHGSEELLDLHPDELIDSVQLASSETVYPFAFAVQYRSTPECVINELEPGVYSFDLEGIIENLLLETTPADRISVMHAPYRYSDESEIFLSFPLPVSLVNGGDMTRAQHCAAGSFQLKTDQMDERTIRVMAKYSIVKDDITPDEYKELRSLNAFAEQAALADVIVKRP